MIFTGRVPKSVVDVAQLYALVAPDSKFRASPLALRLASAIFAPETASTAAKVFVFTAPAHAQARSHLLSTVQRFCFGIELSQGVY